MDFLAAPREREREREREERMPFGGIFVEGAHIGR